MYRIIAFISVMLMLGLLLIMLWCFTKAPSKEDVEDYYEAIYRETMHELKDYDEN